MTDKKQTAEEWLNSQSTYFGGPANLTPCYSQMKSHMALEMACAEGEEKGRRETAKEAWHFLKQFDISEHDWQKIDEYLTARFLPKEKEHLHRY